LPEPFGVIISVIKKHFTLPGKYFTGDGALRDEVGYYRITGRVDDVVIVSGQPGTAPIEDAINEHPAVAGQQCRFPSRHKGNALYGFVILKKQESLATENLIKSTNKCLTRSDLSPS
jgi:acetyl-CoA synthetase